MIRSSHDRDTAPCRADLYEEMLAVFRRALPEEHAYLIQVRTDLAVQLSYLGEYERARVLSH